MSNALVSARARRLALALALSALVAGTAEAQPQQPRPAAPAPVAIESFGDFFQWLAAEFLGGESDFGHVAEESELDSEIEVDPPNPFATTQPERGHGFESPRS